MVNAQPVAALRFTGALRGPPEPHSYRAAVLSAPEPADTAAYSSVCQIASMSQEPIWLNHATCYELLADLVIKARAALTDLQLVAIRGLASCQLPLPAYRHAVPETLLGPDVILLHDVSVIAAGWRPGSTLLSVDSQLRREPLDRGDNSLEIRAYTTCERQRIEALIRSTRLFNILSERNFHVSRD